jgi:hypothetical protein
MTLQTHNYITCKFRGRTGNLMFQIAHAYAKSLEYNRQLLFSKNELELLNLQHTLFKKLEFSPFVSTHDNNGLIQGKFYYEELIPSYNSPTIFSGYYQSEKYFKKYTESIKSLFSYPFEFLEKAYNEYPFLKNSTVAAINVRRGDYLHYDQSVNHPSITLEYINEAYKHLPQHDVLLIMSDDIEWCKENINLPNMVFNDNSKFWNEEGIWLLSLCDHFIISNSTYSWWGAWMSRNPNKTVVSPSTWFGPGVKEDPKDIWCDDWIKIPTKYDNGFIVLDK